MILGEVRLLEFLEAKEGNVYGRLVTDAKNRYYTAQYEWERAAGGNIRLHQRDRGDTMVLPQTIPLDEPLVAFFGLYSGDGAKGAETAGGDGRVRPPISFSQRESNLIRFATQQFRRLLSGNVGFRHTIGEDSAYFMDGAGLDLLTVFYCGMLPDRLPLERVRPAMDGKDETYLRESRVWQRDPRIDLAFYYQHKDAMEQILSQAKREHLTSGNIEVRSRDSVAASLRRPFKKGARKYGQSSRSDELDVLGVNGLGELFLLMLHEIEASILSDTQVSPQGFVHWANVPSKVGGMVDLRGFFANSPFGKLGRDRPAFFAASPSGTHVQGKWPRAGNVLIAPELRISPLWCYASGLYFAEGTTDKNACFQAFQTGRTSGFGIGFTSSEGMSIELVLRALQELFPPASCVEAWKVKVGAQYFPELVVIGLKNGVPMLRGGQNGQGKLRTMEISLAVKEWALSVAPFMQKYADKYSHVEPTGSGVPRIDFWASSQLCRWVFPLMVYAMFGGVVADTAEFTA